MQQKTLHLFLCAISLFGLTFTACEMDDEDFFNFREPTFLVFADALVTDVGGDIAYRDESIGATSWEWTFEGGTPATSTDREPTIVYNEEGNYATNLVATFNDGRVERRTLFVTVVPPVVADFTVPTTQNITDVPVQFTNLTMGVGTIPDVVGEADTFILYEWNFEGGSPATSTQSNPSVTYSSTGTYDVSLKVTRVATDFTDEITRTDYMQIVDVPILDARTIKFNRDHSQILIIADEAFAAPTAATAAGFSLNDGSGGSVAMTGASIASYNANTLVLDFDRSLLSSGDYTLEFNGEDVIFASESVLGAFSQSLRFAADITWAGIIYDMNGNLVDREVDLGGGKTLLWTTTGSPFSFATDAGLNILSPGLAGYLTIGFRNTDSGVDYVVTANPGPNTTYDDVRAVGLEYSNVGPVGTIINFSAPVTDWQGHTDGMAVTISTDGLSATVDQNDPGRTLADRITFILENPADVANLVLSHNAPQNQNVYVTAAGY